MRLLDRENISKEYGIPHGSIDTRMAELGVLPHLPPRKGRGWKIQYDADEIEIALINDREKRLVANKMRTTSMRRRSKDSIMSLSWKAAKQRLTNTPLPQ